jgi:hypothetical protein
VRQYLGGVTADWRHSCSPRHGRQRNSSKIWSCRSSRAMQASSALILSCSAECLTSLVSIKWLSTGSSERSAKSEMWFGKGAGATHREFKFPSFLGCRFPSPASISWSWDIVTLVRTCLIAVLSAHLGSRDASSGRPPTSFFLARDPSRCLPTSHCTSTSLNRLPRHACRAGVS